MIDFWVSYRTSQEGYKKECDITDETYRFDLPTCSIDFDFSKIWKI